MTLKMEMLGWVGTSSQLLHLSKRHPVHIRPDRQHHGHYGNYHSRPQGQSDLPVPPKDGFGGARSELKIVKRTARGGGHSCRKQE